MRANSALRLLALVMLAVLAFPSAAVANHADEPRTKNMHPMGESSFPGSFLPGGNGANSDIAFWGKLAIHGHYKGFRIVDITEPDNPVQVSFQDCDGDQGDVLVYGNIVVRSWNSAAPSGRLCDGASVPAGFEGLHVFDISNLADPALVASVDLPCGSHTTTLVPDHANDRLIVYNNNSSGNAACDGGTANGDFIDVVEVPLSNPAASALIHREPLPGPTTPGVAPGCHDMGVILGNVNLGACASADTTSVFDISDPADPVVLYTIFEPGVGDLTQGSGRWHSASFTWDGKVLILGWEPGGGAAPRCTATGTVLPGGVVQTDTHKSFFFYDAATGAKLGTWVLPRDQSLSENCTLHNYNVVPTSKGYVLVHGSYQSGTSVVDFTDPANAVEIGWTDPDPLVPQQLGGAWSSYWYNGRIYESDITTGLRIYEFSHRAVAGAKKLPHLNPQTQESTIP